MKNTAILLLCHLLCITISLQASLVPHNESHRQTTNTERDCDNARQERKIMKQTLQLQFDTLQKGISSRPSDNKQEEAKNGLSQKQNTEKQCNTSPWIVTENGCSIDYSIAPVDVCREKMNKVCRHNTRLKQEKSRLQTQIALLNEQVTYLKITTIDQQKWIDLKQEWINLKEEQHLAIEDERALDFEKYELKNKKLQLDIDRQLLKIIRLKLVKQRLGLVKQRLGEDLSAAEQQQKEINSNHEQVLKKEKKIGNAKFFFGISTGGLISLIIAYFMHHYNISFFPTTATQAITKIS